MIRCSYCLEFKETVHKCGAPRPDARLCNTLNGLQFAVEDPKPHPLRVVGGVTQTSPKGGM